MAENQLFQLLDSPDGDPIDTISFDPLPVSTSDEKTVYVHNISNGEMTIESASVVDESGNGTIEIVDQPTTLDPDERGELELRASSVQADTLRGISASISITANTIVRPTV